MADARENVTIPVSVDLENFAHGLINTLDGNGVQSFIFQLVSLRNNTELDRELAEELGTPYDATKAAASVDYPSGSDEPSADVLNVRCVRTSAVWSRTGKTWSDQAIWTDGQSEATWYQLNKVDPMSEGFTAGIGS